MGTNGHRLIEQRTTEPASAKATDEQVLALLRQCAELVMTTMSTLAAQAQRNADLERRVKALEQTRAFGHTCD
jgi:hypothetical protein